MAYAVTGAVGCVELIPLRDGIYELSKMAVSPHLRAEASAAGCFAIAQARGLFVSWQRYAP
jgi:hypothetical protein